MYSGDEELHRREMRLADECDNYQAEVVAINEPAKYIKDMKIERATLTDSLSALEALKGMQKPTELLLETWKIIHELNVELK